MTVTSSPDSPAQQRRLPDVVVRPETPDDDAALRAVYASTRASEMVLVDWAEAQKDAFLRMQFDAQHRHYRAACPGAAFQVIECDGEVVGRYYVHRAADNVQVVDISLLPRVRGRGIGTALLSRTVADASARQCPVSLHVEIGNPAQRLYERLGFRVVEVRDFRLLMSTSAAPGSGA